MEKDNIGENQNNSKRKIILGGGNTTTSPMYWLCFILDKK